MDSFGIVVCEQVRIESLQDISRFSYVNAFSSIDKRRLAEDDRFEFAVTCMSDMNFPETAELLIRILRVGDAEEREVGQHRAKLIGNDRYILATGSISQSLFMHSGLYRIQLYYRRNPRDKWPPSPNASWMFQVTDQSNPVTSDAA